MGKKKIYTVMLMYIVLVYVIGTLKLQIIDVGKRESMSSAMLLSVCRDSKSLMTVNFS